MRTTRSFLLSIVCLFLAVAGCGSTDIGDILGGGSSPSQLDDVRGTAAYRRHALRVLASRALERCLA